MDLNEELFLTTSSKKHHYVTAILSHTNMPESRQNNACHQLTNWSATFIQWTWEKPEQWTGNRRFFTPRFQGSLPPLPPSLSLSVSVSLSLSLGTGRREPWERGFCSPRLAHGAKMPRLPRLAHNAPVMQANSIRNTNFDYKIISLRSWPYGRSFRKESLR